MESRRMSGNQLSRSRTEGPQLLLGQAENWPDLHSRASKRPGDWQQQVLLEGNGGGRNNTVRVKALPQRRPELQFLASVSHGEATVQSLPGPKPVGRGLCTEVRAWRTAGLEVGTEHREKRTFTRLVLRFPSRLLPPPSIR